MKILKKKSLIFNKNTMLLPLVFLLMVPSIRCLKILAVFPTPSISHQVVFRPLTQELAKRGHEVTIITPDPAFIPGQAPKNIKEIDLHNSSYTVWGALVDKAKAKDLSLLSQFKLFAQLFLEVFNVQLQTEQFQRILKLDKNHFDLLLLEACVTPTLGLSYLFDAPVIQISSLGNLLNDHQALGIPMHPFLYPTSARRRIHNLSLLEKFEALIEVTVANYIITTTRRKENELLRESFGLDIPSLESLANNIDMLFLNTHPMWSGNYPVPPNVIFMGGIHQNPRKDLPKNLKSWLDSSENGVIYVSFGTNLNSENIPEKTKQTFANVFSKLPYDVLLKWDKDVLLEKYTNVKISKWLPQADLLRHPKIKLFITQGGLQSTDEAITAGVPMIGIPFVVDQSFNVEKYVHFNIGLKLNIKEITEQNLKDSIEKVIGDENYRKNVVKLRNLMNDQPQSPLERTVWWTEYVMRHRGAKHLRSPAANMSWLEYFEIELLMVLISLFVSIVAILFVTLKYLVLLIRNKLTKSKIKTH